MKKLNQQEIERLDAISSKYRFRSHYEIESGERPDFVRAFLQAVHLGLCVDEEDLNWLQTVFYETE